MMDVTSNNSNFGKTIIVLGDKETGKTSLLHRFVKNKFYENYMETLGIDIN